MIITIEDKKFNQDDIKKLYPAAIVKTGYKDETTQISLEWLDTECNGAVEVVEYGIFLKLKDNSQHSFIYKNRDEFELVIENISKQFSK